MSRPVSSRSRKTRTHRLAQMEAIEPRIFLSGDYTPQLFPLEERPSSALQGNYRANVLTQVDRTTGQQKATVSATVQNLVNYSGGLTLAHIIDGNKDVGMQWKPDQTPPDPDEDIHATVTINFNDVHLISAVDVLWFSGRAPDSYTLEAYTDGQWVQLPNATVKERWHLFDPIPVEQLRIHTTGVNQEATNVLLNLAEVSAFLDAQAAAPGTGDGYNLSDIAGFNEMTDVTGTPGQWAKVAGTAHTSDVNLQGNKTATTDAVAEIDLFQEHPLVALHFGFKPGQGWAYGTKIEIAGEDRSFHTVFDTSSSWTGGEFDLSDFGSTTDVRYIRITNKKNPNADGNGEGAINTIEIFTATPTPHVPVPLDVVTVEDDALLSAGIYDQDGTLVQMLRHGIPVSPGQYPLYWDGRDITGKPVELDETYELKVLLSQATATQVTGVGNTGLPGETLPPMTVDTMAPSNPVSVAFDPQGNLYVASDFEETGKNIRKINPNGEIVWVSHVFSKHSKDVTTFASAIATDGNYVWFAGGNSIDALEYYDRVHLIDAATGALVNYTNRGQHYIPINENKASDPPEGELEVRGIHGMAVETTGNGLFVSNSYLDRVELYDKRSGDAILFDDNPVYLELTNPVGLAIEPGGGAFWVTYESGGSRVVSRFTYDPDTYEITTTPTHTISSGLDDPWGLAIGGWHAHAAFTAATNDVATAASHGLSTGDAVRVTTTDALPGGLSADTTYWVNVIDTDTFTFHATRADALTGSNAIDITSAGSGTHTLTRPHLYVSEHGDLTNGEDRHIREYDLSGNTNSGWLYHDFGSNWQPGEVLEDEFHDPRSLAVNDAGELVVRAAQRMIYRYDAQGNRVWFTHGEYVPEPQVVQASIDGNTNLMISGGYEYQVRVDGGTLPDGEADGRWKLTNVWTPADNRFFTPSYFGTTFRTTIPLYDVNGDPIMSGGQQVTGEYLFHIDKTGVIVYQIENGTTRRSSIVGKMWTGELDDLDGVNKQWTWTDAGALAGDGDGDSVVEGVVDGQLQTDEVRFISDSLPFSMDLTGSVWVNESDGTIYFSRYHIGSKKGVAKLPIRGFQDVGNGRYNPIYDFDDVINIVPSAELGDLPFGINPATAARPTGDDGVMIIGSNTDVGRPVVARYDAEGNVVLSIPTILKSDLDTNELAIDPDPNSGYWFESINLGPSHHIYLRNADGLVLAVASPDEDVWAGSWVDGANGLSTFFQNGKRYLYAEDVWFGKSNLYEFDGEENVSTYNLLFNWPGLENWTGPNEFATVTLSASGDTIHEDVQNSVTISATRVGSVAEPLEVQYTLTGTGSAGDVTANLTGTLVIPAGQHTGTLVLTPVQDSTQESTETFNFAFAHGEGYFLAGNTHFSVSVIDDDAPAPTVTIEAIAPGEENAAGESGEATSAPARFRVTRSGAGRFGDLVVAYQVSGTATGGSDYTAPTGYVTIPDGQFSAEFSIDVLDDSTAEDSETLIVTLVDPGTAFENDGTSHIANLARRRDPVTGALLATASSSAANGGVVESLYPVSNIIDGNDNEFRWKSSQGANDTDATATAQIELDQVYSVNRVIVTWPTTLNLPDTFDVKVSDDGSSWTTVASGVTPVNGKQTVNFSATDTKYVQVVMTGTPASNLVKLDNVAVFAAASAPAPKTTEGYNLGYLPAVTGSDTGLAGDVSSLFDQYYTGVNGSAAATSPGVADLDLGAEHTLFAMDLGFRLGQTWEHGAKIELSTDNSTWTTVFDSDTPVGKSNITFDPTQARYIRITNKLDPSDNVGTGTGRLDELEIFARAPYIVDGQAGAATGVIIDDDNDQPTLSVAAQPATAAEGGEGGGFVISRAGTGRRGDLLVYYNVAGSASAGDDYNALTGSVLIPDGQLSTTIPISAVDDLLVDPDETIILTIDGTQADTTTAFDHDGTSYRPSLLNRYNVTGKIGSVSATYSNGAQPNQDINRTIDGDDSPGRWSSGSPDEDATAVLVFDLKEIRLINRVRHYYEQNTRPLSYSIRVSEDGQNWTTVVSSTAASSDNITDTFTATNARYIEYTGVGTQGSNAMVSMAEFFAYAAESGDAPTSDDGLDLMHLPGRTVTLSSGGWSGGAASLYDDAITGITGSGTTTSDATINVDLGASYLLHTMLFGFRLSQGWAYGAKIELSTNGSNWTTVHDTDSNFSNSVIRFTPQNARYVRITNKLDPSDNTGVGSGRLDWLSIYGSNMGYDVDLNADEATITIADNDIAVDGFESGDGAGGSGWAGNWSFSGAAAVTSGGSPMTGSHHLQLTGNNGVATRAANLAAHPAATLALDWKASSFESGDLAVVEIYDGSVWHTVLTVGEDESDDEYRHSEINLSGFSLTSSFQVRIRSLMDGGSSAFYVDNLVLVSR
jgi:hypothetical protein